MKIYLYKNTLHWCTENKIYVLTDDAGKTQNLQLRPIWGKENRREKKGKRFWTAGVMVAHNRNPKGNFFPYFCQ